MYPDIAIKIILQQFVEIPSNLHILVSHFATTITNGKPRRNSKSLPRYCSAATCMTIPS